jgi:hypothetical protein
MTNFDIATDITQRLLNLDLIKQENWAQIILEIEDCLDSVENERIGPDNDNWDDNVYFS